MSSRNREKRAAKRKSRLRAFVGREQPPTWASADPGNGPGNGPGAAPGADRGMFEVALQRAARCSCGDAERHARTLLGQFDAMGRELDLGADAVLATAIRGAWEGGWLPSDLQELARRTVPPAVAGYLCEAIVAESRRYASATLHPRWQAAIGAIAAGLDHEVAAAAQLRDWARRHATSRVNALAVLIQVLSVLAELPMLERLLPLPGAQRHAASPAGEVDQKVLAKVRALLAKAESTEFPDEAEALSAKAQELMSRYSLHQAVLERDRGHAPAASGRRLWMDAPYPGAKVLLVQAVAQANRARTVWREKPGFVTVVGPDTELDIVELLTTSLLLQASRAMLAAGRQVTRGGTSRTRSFRQSFWWPTRPGSVSACSRPTPRPRQRPRQRPRLRPQRRTASTTRCRTTSCCRCWRPAAERPTR
jgi:Protein of unknown function (DUF2786)